MNEKAVPLGAVAPKTNKQENEQKRMLVSHVKSTRYSSHILINFVFFDGVSKNPQIQYFKEIHLVRNELFPCELTDMT